MSALEQMTKVPLAKKVAVLILFALLLGVAYYFLYFDPLNQELEGLRGDHTRLKQEHRDAERRRATYVQDQRRRDELRKSYAQQIRALPAESEMSSFLNSLNTQAELVGLEIQAVKPLAEQPQEYYARIPVSLKLIGTYHELAKFFYLVGNLERVINIENIKLSPVVNKDENELRLTAEVMATTFRSVQPASG